MRRAARAFRLSEVLAAWYVGVGLSLRFSTRSGDGRVDVSVEADLTDVGVELMIVHPVHFSRGRPPPSGGAPLVRGPARMLHDVKQRPQPPARTEINHRWTFGLLNGRVNA